MAEVFKSLSADLPAGLWALLVVGAMLLGATALFLWWEMFFRLVGVAWRWVAPSRCRSRQGEDAGR